MKKLKQYDRVVAPSAKVADMIPPPEDMYSKPFSETDKEFGVHIPRRMNESTFQRSIAAKRGYLRPRGFPKIKSRRLK